MAILVAETLKAGGPRGATGPTSMFAQNSVAAINLREPVSRLFSDDGVI